MSGLQWKMFFDGWAPVLRTLVLGILAYVGLIILLRVSGKRTLSKMNAFDFVVTIALGSTLASVLTSQQVSLVQGLTALGLLILLQFLFTYFSVRSERFKRLIKDQPTLVFFKGQFLVDAMRQQRITHGEILAAMRQQRGIDPDNVDAVVLETEGSLSVMCDHVSTTERLQTLGVDTAASHDKL